jgi:hypothetical protein
MAVRRPNVTAIPVNSWIVYSPDVLQRCTKQTQSDVYQTERFLQ